MRLKYSIRENSRFNISAAICPNPNFLHHWPFILLNHHQVLSFHLVKSTNGSLRKTNQKQQQKTYCKMGRKKKGKVFLENSLGIQYITTPDSCIHLSTKYLPVRMKLV